MTSFDDLTDSSPEGPVGVPEELTEEPDPRPDPRADAERGNLDGSTAHEDSRADSLDDSREAVRDPSEAGPQLSALGPDVGHDHDDPQSADAGDSGQDNGLNE